MEVNKNKIIKNTFFLYAKTIISTIVVFFSTRVVLNALGATDYGVYGIVGGVIAMLGYLNVAMSTATQRYMNIAEGARDENRILSIFNNAVIIHAIIGLSVVLILESLYFWMFNGVLNIPPARISAAKVIYHLMAISTFFTMISVPYDAMINAHEDFLYYSIVGIFESLMKLGAAFSIVYFSGDKLLLYGVLMASVSVLMMIILRLYCHRKYKYCKLNILKYGNRKSIQELSAFAGWNFVGAFSSISGNYGSTILMNHFFGTIVIAAKNIGDQIGAELQILTSNLTKALNPVIMKSEGGGERNRMISLSLTACRFGFLLYSFLAVPFIFETEYILGLWLKNIPQWAILFCQLQVLRTLTEQLFQPLRTMLIAEGSIRNLNLMDLLLGVLTFCCLFILYKIGFPAYWHYIVSILLMVIIEAMMKLVYCHIYCSLSYINFFDNAAKKSLLTILVSSTVCWICVRTLTNLNGLLLVSIMCFMSLLSIVYIGLSISERQYIMNLIGKHL